MKRNAFFIDPFSYSDFSSRADIWGVVTCYIAWGYGRDGGPLSLFGGLIYDKSCFCCRIMFSIVANFLISEWLSSWFIVTNVALSSNCHSQPANSPAMIILKAIFEYTGGPHLDFFYHHLLNQFWSWQILAQLIFIIRLYSMII